MSNERIKTMIDELKPFYELMDKIKPQNQQELNGSVAVSFERLKTHIADIRAQVIEECAKVADQAHTDSLEHGSPIWADEIAKSIRALKGET
jgi:hypothetical protein